MKPKPPAKPPRDTNAPLHVPILQGLGPVTTVSSQPLFLNSANGVYSAWSLRSAMEAWSPGEGVAGFEDFRVIQRAAGANMSVDVGSGGRSDGLMRAWVRGDTRSGQGLYFVDNLDRTQPTTSAHATSYNVPVTAQPRRIRHQRRPLTTDLAGVADRPRDGHRIDRHRRRPDHHPLSVD